MYLPVKKQTDLHDCWQECGNCGELERKLLNEDVFFCLDEDKVKTCVVLLFRN